MLWRWQKLELHFIKRKQLANTMTKGNKTMGKSPQFISKRRNFCARRWLASLFHSVRFRIKGENSVKNEGIFNTWKPSISLENFVQSVSADEVRLDISLLIIPDEQYVLRKGDKGPMGPTATIRRDECRDDSIQDFLVNFSRRLKLCAKYLHCVSHRAARIWYIRKLLILSSWKNGNLQLGMNASAFKVSHRNVETKIRNWK